MGDRLNVNRQRLFGDDRIIGGPDERRLPETSDFPPLLNGVGRDFYKYIAIFRGEIRNGFECFLKLSHKRLIHSLALEASGQIHRVHHADAFSQRISAGFHNITFDQIYIIMF